MNEQASFASRELFLAHREADLNFTSHIGCLLICSRL